MIKDKYCKHHSSRNQISKNNWQNHYHIVLTKKNLIKVIVLFFPLVDISALHLSIFTRQQAVANSREVYVTFPCTKQLWDVYAKSSTKSVKPSYYTTILYSKYHYYRLLPEIRSYLLRFRRAIEFVSRRIYGWGAIVLGRDNFRERYPI